MVTPFDNISGFERETKKAEDCLIKTEYLSETASDSDDSEYSEGSTHDRCSSVPHCGHFIEPMSI